MRVSRRSNEPIPTSLAPVMENSGPWPHIPRTTLSRTIPAPKRVRMFPNQASALRLIHTLKAEINQRATDEHRYLNTEFAKDKEREYVFNVT